MTDQPLNEVNLGNLNKDTLLDLASQAHTQSISIFIPTHQRGKEVNEGQDIIAFKNHVQRIRLALEAQSLRSNEVNELMQPLENLLDDTQFWRHQQQGLAVFRNPNYFAVFHSPIPLENSSRLDTSFYVQPLLPFAQRSPVYCLLQISKKGVSLFKADTYSITPLELADSMPSGLEDVTKYYDFEEELQGRTKGRSGSMAMYTSSENAEDKEKDHLLADYFRLIDTAIVAMMGTQNLPLVLASVAYFQPIYHDINTYPHLHKEGLTGNFDHTQPEELHQMAQELLGDSIEQDKQRRINQYQNSSGSDLVSSNDRELLKAAVTGRIDTLFLKTDASLWGHFDENTLKTTIHEEKQDGDESLVQKIALLTLRNGGQVYVMDEFNLLENQEPVDMAALFRF
ncbi:baeRF7 domain-containing protein [Spirosoma fluminis]